MSLAVRVALWLEARGSRWGGETLVQAGRMGDVAVNRRALELYAANPGTAPGWVHDLVRRQFEVDGAPYTMLWHPRGGLDVALDALRDTFEPACLAWLTSGDAHAQRVAALSLGYYGTTSASAAIVALLDATAASTKRGEHHDPELLRAAVAAFLRIPPADPRAVILRLRAKFHTTMLGNDLYVALLKRFGQTAAILDEAISDRLGGRRLLDHVKAHGPKLLEELLDHPDPGKVAFAASDLLPTMTDAARVRSLLAHPYEHVRMAAHRRLGVLGLFEVQALLDDLAKATHHTTVKEIAELLLRAGDPVAVEPLRRALESPHMREDQKHESLVPAFGEALAVFDTPHARALSTKYRIEACSRVEAIIAALEALTTHPTT